MGLGDLESEIILLVKLLSQSIQDLRYYVYDHRQPFQDFKSF